MSGEIDRDNEQFNQGVTHVVEMLAERIEAPPTWVAGDGSEDYDADLGTTLLNILAAKGLYDRDECTFAGQWQPIETAPTGDDDFFLVGCDDPADERSPFVVRGSIFKSARQSRTPGHLSLHHLTHWQPLPAKPQRGQWCTFCKKHHAGGDTCMGHHP